MLAIYPTCLATRKKLLLPLPRPTWKNPSIKIWLIEIQTLRKMLKIILNWMSMLIVNSLLVKFYRQELWRGPRKPSCRKLLCQWFVSLIIINSRSSIIVMKFIWRMINISSWPTLRLWRRFLIRLLWVIPKLNIVISPSIQSPKNTKKALSLHPVLSLILASSSFLIM